MNTLTQMARTYRNMCKQVQRTDAHIRKAKARVHELSHARNQTVQELDHLRTLMEYCVVTGEEPTQAKLSHTVEQMNITINEHRRHMRMDEFYYTTSSSTITVGTTGLIQLNTGNTTSAMGSNVATGTSVTSSITNTNHLIPNLIDLTQ